MSDQHEAPIKTPRQLIIIIVLAFIVPITLIVLLSQLMTSGEKGLQDNQNAVLARIKAVGEVTLAAPSGPKGQATGAEVYNQVCKTCHETGLAGAPKVGDKAAWVKVIAQGSATVFDHALMASAACRPRAAIRISPTSRSSAPSCIWRTRPAPRGRIRRRRPAR